jgi:molecular chaperone DnaK
MVKDAESHAEEDKKRREQIELRNQADSLVYSTEKILRENRDKLSPDDIQAVETAIKDTKAAIDTGDTTAIKAKLDALNSASHKIAEAMYKQASSSAQPGGPASGQSTTGDGQGTTGGGETVVDAEFEETDK